MSLRRAAPMVAVALLCMVPMAHAAGGWMIGVNGGWTFPTGDYGSADSTGLEAQSGPQVGLEVSYMVNERVAVGIDGTWIQNTHKAEGDVYDLGGGTTLTANKDKFKIMRFGAHARFMMPMKDSSVHPYGLVGIGVYNMKEDYEYTLAGGGAPTTVFTDESDNVDQPGSRFGGRIGLGAMFKAAEKISIDVRGDFNFISMDENKTGISSAQFMGLQAGLIYHIMPK